MKEIKQFLEKNRRILVTAASFMAVYLSFKYLLPLLIPFAVAYLLALIIKRPVRFLYRRAGIKPVISGSFLTMVMLAVIGIILYFIIDMAVSQLMVLIENIPEYIAVIEEKLDGICRSCDRWLGFTDGTVSRTMLKFTDNTFSAMGTELMSSVSDMAPAIMLRIFEFAGVLLIVIVAVILIAKDMGELEEKPEAESGFYPWAMRIRKSLSAAGMTYLKVQGIILLIIAAVCSVGLFIIGNPYALLIGTGIAVIDALPVLGSGLILIPWGVIVIIQGSYREGMAVILIFVICQLVRQILEPRLLGDKIGVKPVYTLISMYVGIKLFGVIGFLLGPLGLVIIKNICATVIDME